MLPEVQGGRGTDQLNKMWKGNFVHFQKKRGTGDIRNRCQDVHEPTSPLRMKMLEAEDMLV